MNSFLGFLGMVFLGGGEECYNKIKKSMLEHSSLTIYYIDKKLKKPLYSKKTGL